MTQPKNLNHIDPFHKQSILSLNPKTFRDSKDAVKSNDLDAIHQYMNSMALQDPDKHFEEARSIVDSGSDFLNTRESEDNTKENEDPRRKRPALARKRAKFSMKPSTSQPITIPEPSFTFDQLQGPEEFFAAYEKFEKAKKELKRQRGEDLDEPIIPVTARKPRPEIPRRKAIYQHHVYSSQPENDTSFAQETPQDNIGSPHTIYSQQESVTANCQYKEKDISASVTKTGDKNKLFHELMSSKIASLDANDAMSFLKDRLNIKPVDVDDLQLPDFRGIPRLDLPHSIKNLIKDQSILSDTCALSDSLRENPLGKQKSLSDNSFISIASPTPPRSPFLAISALGKSLSKSIESNDPYSPRDIDLLPVRTSDVIGGHSTHVSKDKGFPVSDTADSLVENQVTEAPVYDVLQKISAEVPVISHETDIFSEPLISIEDRERFHNMEDGGEDDVVAGPNVVSDNQTNEGLQRNAAEMVQKSAFSTKLNLCAEDTGDNAHFRCAQDVEENVENLKENAGLSNAVEVNIEAPTIKEIQSHAQSGQTDANSADDLDANRPAQNSDIVLEQHNEGQLRTSMVKRKKCITKRKVDKKKRRQSLAEAGSSWTTGIRRSNRIRRKPLEYWKGERLLYGRVHNSLPTVIGVKYIDPSNKKGEPGFTVESFVSDEYKDLVELTALH